LRFHPQDKVPAASTEALTTASFSRPAEVLMAWGVGLLLGDRPAGAVKVFQRGIDEKALPDDNPAFYFYLAGALALAQRPDDALKAAAIAAEKNPSSARYCGRAAWILYMAKRHAEAERAYLKLLERFDADYVSTETRDVLHDARLALSNLAVIRSDVAKAEEWLEQVLDEFPDDAGASNDLGYLWADQNKHLERAERMIRKAIAAEPENKAYRDSLGWVLFRLEKYPEAVAELQKAAATDKLDGVVLDHLGDAYQKLNRHDEAVAIWHKAAEALRKEKETEKAERVEKKINAI
jgi:tetratricopeptide (TPR) repeat protein